MGEFRTSTGENIFKFKYANDPSHTWTHNAELLVTDVCHPHMTKDERDQLVRYISEFKFLPGGRYIYYAGKPAKFWNNCYLLKGEEDTREEWAALANRAMSCLMTGGGIGIDYSVFRPHGAFLGRTGGEASGPIPLAHSINEIGRNVKQGGSRRSAIYASLNWQHGDVDEFLTVKNWDQMQIPGTRSTIADAKMANFDYPAPLDMTNISLNYDDKFLEQVRNGTLPDIFIRNCEQALRTGEPGFSFNFGEKENETLRNACTEVTSEDDSDVCNLGSINFANIKDIEELKDVVILASKFLVCGTLGAELPYDKVYRVREANRRLGLGIMGLHEWLLQRGYQYEVTPELHEWLATYEAYSEVESNRYCDSLNISRPIAYRSIAPTGTIGMLAGTTTGIEPLYAVAYKRRYLQGTTWKYEYVVDSTAKQFSEMYGVDPDSIDTANSLAQTPEARIKFQADVQDYVDMAISSTINLPSWGSDYNNPEKVDVFASTLAKYAHRLRGFTAYPDGSRGGQPITEVPWREAIYKTGVVYEENQESQCVSGVCGV